MKYILSSSHCETGTPKLSSKYGMAQMLKAALGTTDISIVLVAAWPDDFSQNDTYADWEKDRFTKEGYNVTGFSLLDSRTAHHAQEYIAGADLVILSGGHAPTQNNFFHRINLPQIMKNYTGTVLAISAGSMNSATTVYVQPEEPGEATDPGYRKFLLGLGLTDINILPHYNMVKDNILDGMRLYEDITFTDSMGHSFLVIPDESFVYGDETGETLYGPGYILADGVMTELYSGAKL